MIEPPHHLMQKVNTRTYIGNIREVMVPRADYQLSRDLKGLIQAQRRVRVTVSPSAEHEYRTLDPVRDGANRPVSPVWTVGLMVKPLQEIRLIPLKMAFP